MKNVDDEKALQEIFSWERGRDFPNYNGVLGKYQVLAALEHRRGSSLLDMPCGDGTLTRMLSECFSRVVGVDASHTHLAKAKQLMPHTEFHEALIEEFETSERFDTITMLNVLEHVIDPIEVLRKAATLLSADGILIVHVPNAFAVNRQLAVLMGTLTHCEELSPFDLNVVGHRRSYVMETFLAEFEAAGLKVVATGGVFYKSLSTAQMDWFLANGLWDEGGFGWGREGGARKDWRAEFCRASYEFGKERPEECNVIFACATRT